MCFVVPASCHPLRCQNFPMSLLPQWGLSIYDLSNFTWQMQETRSAGSRQDMECSQKLCNNPGSGHFQYKIIHFPGCCSPGKLGFHWHDPDEMIPLQLLAETMVYGCLWEFPIFPETHLFFGDSWIYDAHGFEM